MRQMMITLMLSLGLVAVGCQGSQEIEPDDDSTFAAVESEEAPTEGDLDGSPVEEGEAGCHCGRFVDEDGDGECDLAGSGECRQARDGRCPCGRHGGTDATDGGPAQSSDGGCEGCGHGAHGAELVDEDGDGACDHASDDGRSCGRGRGLAPCGGHGRGHGRHGGGHRGDFEDEDGDGVCDHASEDGRSCGRGRGLEPCGGHGRGHGRRWRHGRGEG